MVILGIETSCDETAAAMVEDGVKVLASVVASSKALHQKTGGIIPETAAREQIRCLLPVIKETIEQSRVQTFEAIAVTAGPGLIGSLLVGTETARTLAYVWQKPIIPVNHLQAHLYANWLYQPRPRFPAVGLVVSGGHTDLVLMKDHHQIQWLGGTRDDAAGECFDKTARLLGLGYPGGPAIEKAARQAREKPGPVFQNLTLPRPMIRNKNYDFSFSGLKTAVLYQIKKKKKKERTLTAFMAKEIEAAIVEVLVSKTIRVANKFKVKSIILSGGVAANTLLRLKMKAASLKLGIPFFVPSKKFCTDNAAMIASWAYFHLRPLPWQKIKANPSLGIEEMV